MHTRELNDSDSHFSNLINMFLEHRWILQPLFVLANFLIFVVRGIDLLAFVSLRTLLTVASTFVGRFNYNVIIRTIVLFVITILNSTLFSESHRIQCCANSSETL